jgi:long-chain acyl-CoA synthetase
VATSLIGLGIRIGDHVALCAPNSYQWLAFYFGVLKAGAVAVTLSSALSKAELKLQLNDARPKILFTVDGKIDDLDDQRDLPFLEEIISDGFFFLQGY